MSNRYAMLDGSSDGRCGSVTIQDRETGRTAKVSWMDGAAKCYSPHTATEEAIRQLQEAEEEEDEGGASLPEFYVLKGRAYLSASGLRKALPNADDETIRRLVEIERERIRRDMKEVGG